ncbi:MAG: P-loop NTPase [Flavobacteriales bacterium]|jgi:flagellar biosynthesis protein FlhG|tara:strand:- start:1316 stop:2107 length:792 start_codon:yes stop_codon:yes gene_type:complete
MVQSLAFVSGKGGVGKTSLAINAAINLSLSGFKVAILDTDFGLSNANIMMDVMAGKTISDLLAGSCALEDIICHSYAGVKLIPGGSGTLDTMNLDTEQRWKIIRSLDVMEKDLDYLIVDTPAGASNSSIEFAAAVDHVVVTLVGEPTSFMDAYAFIKALHIEKGVINFSVIVNMAKDADTALKDFKSFEKIALTFLPVQLTSIGWMPGSNDIVQSIIARKPFILDKKSKQTVGQCMDVITSNIQKIPHQKKSGIHFFGSEIGL